MSTDTVTIAGIRMSRAAAECVEQTGADPAADLARLRAGLSLDALRAECLDGGDDDDADTIAAWGDYVTALEIEMERGAA